MNQLDAEKVSVRVMDSEESMRSRGNIGYCLKKDLYWYFQKLEMNNSSESSVSDDSSESNNSNESVRVSESNSSNLLSNPMVYMSVLESLPQLGTEKELRHKLLSKLSENFYPYDESRQYGLHVNEELMELEIKLRTLTSSCKCEDCFHQQRFGEDWMYWSFCSINVQIDESYEHHGRKLGVHEIPEFRMKYTTDVLPGCLKYEPLRKFAELLNTMHHKLNARFITAYEFLRPMNVINDELANTVYDDEEVLKNNFRLVSLLNTYDLTKMSLSLYKMIDMNQYIYLNSSNTFYKNIDVNYLHVESYRSIVISNASLEKINLRWLFFSGASTNVVNSYDSDASSAKYDLFYNCRKFIFKLCNDDLDKYTHLILGEYPKYRYKSFIKRN